MDESYSHVKILDIVYIFYASSTHKTNKEKFSLFCNELILLVRVRMW